MYYSLLSSLPLLQGIGADVLLDWQERHVMRIVSVERDEGVVIGQGEYCRTLAMLMEGEMECCLKTGDWELYETISAGQVIEEEAVWSLSQRYARSYRATTDARMLVVSREHVMRTLMQNEIFRINALTQDDFELTPDIIDEPTTEEMRKKLTEHKAGETGGHRKGNTSERITYLAQDAGRGKDTDEEGEDCVPEMTNGNTDDE